MIAPANNQAWRILPGLEELAGSSGVDFVVADTLVAHSVGFLKPFERSIFLIEPSIHQRDFASAEVISRNSFFQCIASPMYGRSPSKP